MKLIRKLVGAHCFDNTLGLSPFALTDLRGAIFLGSEFRHGSRLHNVFLPIWLSVDFVHRVASEFQRGLDAIGASAFPNAKGPRRSES
jgi:hypothetical protein